MLKRIQSGNYVFYLPLFDKNLVRQAVSKVRKSNIDVKEVSEEERIKNIKRCRKRRFIQASLNNKFKYFITLTYDPNGKYNNDTFVKSVKLHFKRKYKNLKYILVPEKHKKTRKGDIHIHALVEDVPYKMFLDEKGHYKTDEIKWGLYDIKLIDNDNYINLIFYLSKYLTKDLNYKYIYSHNLSNEIKKYEIINFKNKIFIDKAIIKSKVYDMYLLSEKNIKIK